MQENKTPEQELLEQQEAQAKETPWGKLIQHKNQILIFKDSPAYKAIWDYLMSQRVLAIQEIMKPNTTVDPALKASVDSHNRGVISGLDKFFEIAPSLEEIARVEGDTK